VPKNVLEKQQRHEFDKQQERKVAFEKPEQLHAPKAQEKKRARGREVSSKSLAAKVYQALCLAEPAPEEKRQENDHERTLKLRKRPQRTKRERNEAS
jgi:uncharacterized membrane protein